MTTTQSIGGADTGVNQGSITRIIRYSSSRFGATQYSSQVLGLIAHVWQHLSWPATISLLSLQNTGKIDLFKPIQDAN